MPAKLDDVETAIDFARQTDLEKLRGSLRGDLLQLALWCKKQMAEGDLSEAELKKRALEYYESEEFRRIQNFYLPTTQTVAPGGPV